MGFSKNTSKFLVESKKAGAQFDETLTLGRQQMVVSPERIESFLRDNGLWPPPGGAEAFHRAVAGTAWWFDTFARALGAKNISSCDVSEYESATIIHDMNQPIASQWEERFDAVIDGGTLEHVFNFPVAISNCMKMVKVGGHLFIYSPANNQCGHGFYQFSPELFYRVLCPENGFEVRRMIMCADGEFPSSVLGVPYPFPVDGPWYSARDPQQIHKRVPLVNTKPTLLCVMARRISREPIFKNTPQQSDYVPQWQAAKPAEAQAAPQASPYEKASPIIAWLRKTFPESVCRELLPKLAIIADPFRLARFRRRNSFSNPEYYERIRD